MPSTEYFYGGKPYSLTPVYRNSAGYSTASQIGTSVDARTANQIKEVSEHLNSGIKVIEVAGHDAGVFESIPKDHLKELNRLSKLTGAELTLHGPMIDPSGITQHGWDKLNQQAAQAQLWSAIERSHDLKPDGNINVTLHASTVGLPAAEMMVKEGKEGKPRMVSMLTVNESTGQIGQIKEEEKYFGGKGGKPVAFDAQKELEEQNKDAWMKTVTNLNFASERGYQDVHRGLQIMKDNPLQSLSEKEIESMKMDPKVMAQMKGEYETAGREIEHGKLYLMEAYRNTKDLYNQIYKKASEDEKKKLNAYAEKITPIINNFENLKKPDELQKFADVVEEGVKLMTEVKPQIFTPLKKFATEKTAETVSNLAWKAYDKFHETAPVISLENHPAYASLLTTGEELRDVVKESRKLFVQKAVKQGLSEGEAEDQAKKLIGATWDVGHINMLRKYGYTDKELIEETKKVAPYVKKVHLSDNFGYEHTELPMGMGNVPIQKMMEKLGEKGFEGPKIVEALQWWQHFSPGGKMNPPYVPTLQAFGAATYEGGPSWNHVYGGVPGGYFSGYGTMLPEQHFQMYGAGFSSLPMELGGQVPSKDSKFSGTPMA